jgi:D-lyxose ketol-isomerase
MQRRSLLKAAAASPLVLGLGLDPSNAAEAPRPALRNEEFYTDGKFDEQKAKDGVLALCRWFGYPVFPELREGLWVSDYGTGQFARLGLAAYMFKNQYDDGDAYMLMDLFLLPGQMLPEHWHLEGDHGITKNEGWLVRWGKSYIVGIGEDNLASFPQIEIPEFHCQGTATTRHVVETTPGMFVPLAKSESRHWQYGGPDGAVVTEVANFHTNSAVRHSDPVLNRYFLDS